MSLRRLPFLANSDFHKPRHIFSWTTLLHREKDAEALKERIRRNEHVSIALYRGESASVPVERSARITEETLVPVDGSTSHAGLTLRSGVTLLS